MEALQLRESSATKACIVMLSISVIIGLTFMPVLLTHIKGPRKFFSLLQQVSILTYFSIALIHQLQPKSLGEVLEKDAERLLDINFL